MKRGNVSPRGAAARIQLGIQVGRFSPTTSSWDFTRSPSRRLISRRGRQDIQPTPFPWGKEQIDRQIAADAPGRLRSGRRAQPGHHRCDGEDRQTSRHSRHS